jgi:hypothetical protein
MEDERKERGRNQRLEGKKIKSRRHGVRAEINFIAHREKAVRGGERREKSQAGRETRPTTGKTSPGGR